MPFLLPWWTKYAAIAAAVLACWLHGYHVGGNRMQAKWGREKAVQEVAYHAEVERLSELKSKVQTVYMDRVRVVEQAARVITKEVPKYVTVKADARCPVPVGFVRLWNDSAGVQTDLYQPASGVDDPAPGVALSDVGNGVVEARRRFEANRAQCEALMAWAAGRE